MKFRGYTMAEMLVGIACLSILIHLIVHSLALTTRLYHHNRSISQRDLFELQMQHEIMVSRDFKISENTLSYINIEGLKRCIIFDKNRIVKNPGYEILLVDVTHYSIHLEENSIKIRYSYQKEKYESNFIIVKK